MHAQAWPHTPVLLHEAIEAILGDSGGTYVDGTFGRGGHSRALLARLSPAGRLIAFDKDPQAVQAAAEGPERIDDPRFVLEHASFASMREHLAAREISSVHGVLLDLGVSSPQMTMEKNGLLFRLQKRLLLAARAGVRLDAPSSWPKSWLVRSRPANRARTLQRARFKLFGFSSTLNSRTSNRG
jgi:16S rRNA C1402 N4-methylase RsmH